MKILKYINTVFVLISLLALASCEKEADSLDSGYLQLSLSSDESLIEIGTKADTEPIYKVQVVNASGVTVATYNNHQEMETNPLKLVAGKYTVKASTGEDGGEAAFEMPVYTGEAEVDVKAGQTNSVEVVCSLSQVKVTVTCDQEVSDSFPSILVLMTNADDFSDSRRNLIFNSESGDMGKAAYFKCSGKLKYSITLTNTDGRVFADTVKGTINDVKVKEWYKINLTLSEGEEGSAITPGITVDGSTNKHEHNLVVNLNKKPKPAFTTNGFDISKTAYVSIGSSLTWKVNILAKAGIERLILAHNSDVLTQKGIPASFDLVTVDNATTTSVNNAGIVWSGISDGTKENMQLDFSALLASLGLGDYEFVITALDKQAQEVQQDVKFKVIPSVETSTISAEAWGKHAFVYGMYNTQEQPAGMGFEYKKAIEPTWTKVTNGLTIDGINYSVKLTGLEPRTVYVVRTVSDKESSNEIEFTTLGADQIKNMSFDNWIKNGRHWYANASLNDGDFWWDSGNEGANTMSEVNPTKPEESNVAVKGEGKKAARLTSSTAAGQFAAGSLFLGDFGKATLSPLGAKLNFGRPYSCKPLSLKGWYNYTPKTIDKAKDPHADKKGQSDICQVYIVLADWPAGYFEVSTGDNKFIDFDNDPNIIGYGCLEKNTSTNGWQQFDIPIEYRNNRIPTTCLIVCSSSKYGDYFTGGVGSCLIVDEFEFVF